MRAIDQLVHSRARVRDRWALMPLEGFPVSRLPAWQLAEARVLASPALGARFVQYLIDVQPDGGTSQPPDNATESFLYCLGGEAHVSLPDRRITLIERSFAFIPHAVELQLKATAPSRLIVLRKTYEPAAGLKAPTAVVGNLKDVPHQPFFGNKNARLQTLIPEDLGYDLAMNVFTFDPGHCLPVVETHVMEHGLYFLQGKGLYMLGEEWMEVQKDDFIWMGPYCPQCFYATGAEPAMYLYYKNVNREPALL
jgi:(S)-ureidoglycine aminohydrolase